MPLDPDQNGDAYRVLGLQPGASKAEVKRAYRLLAKAFHPDSAGEAALPRFLAIHEAYDRLTTGRVSTTPRAAARPAPQAEPWRADPTRARQARERARTARGAAGRTGAGSTGSTGAGTSGSAGAGGPGATSGSSTSGPRPTSGTRGSGRRHVRKATMGSTSYDEARDANDPTWSGASWYGPSSGEYWIVNPREYADPRKHGPAYQSRARRPLPGDDGAIGAKAAAGTAASAEPEMAAQAEAADASAADWTARPAQAGSAARSPRWGSSPSTSSWSAPAGEAAARRPEATGVGAPPVDREPPVRGAERGWLAAASDDPIRRLGLALVAWPPIGLAAAAVIGNATGCASYSAACGGAEPVLPWLAQAAILGLLLLVPAFARILAGGTIALVLLLVPVTLFLVAIGGAGAPQLGFVSSVLLGIAWVVGVGWSALAAGGFSRRSAGA